MTNRRDFVRDGLALSALGASGLSWRRASAVPIGRPVAHSPATVLAIADWTFEAASAEFAQETERYGIDARGFDSDVGGLWLHELEPAIAAGGAAVIGFTGAGVLFCLETLSRTHGFGAVFRAERPASAATGWPRVAARHALEAAAAANLHGGATLAPFEHDFPSRVAEPRLLVWALARGAHRPSPRHT